MPRHVEYEVADIYGTARIYTHSVVEPHNDVGVEPLLEEQREKLLAVAKTLPCRGISDAARYSDSDTPKSTRRFEDRPGIQLLLNEIERKDIVLIWSLEMATSTVPNAAMLLRLLADSRAAMLAAHQYGQIPLMLDGNVIGLWADAVGTARDIEAERLRKRQLRIIREARRVGRYIGGNAPTGRRIVEKRGMRTLAWDGHECRLMMEMWARVQTGETLMEIWESWKPRQIISITGRNLALQKGRKRRLAPDWFVKAQKVMKIAASYGLDDPRGLNPLTLTPDVR